MDATQIFRFSRLIILSVALFSCSKFARLTESERVSTVRFGTSNPESIASTPMTGGVVIWGREATANLNMAILLPTDTAYQNLSIPFGNWTFYAAGWPGAEIFLGTTRCGSSNVQVDSNTTSVTISMSAANCSGATMLGGAGIKPLRITTCSILANVADGNSECNGLDRGDLRSFDISGLAYAPAPPGNGGITLTHVSDCVSLTTPATDSTVNTGMFVPDSVGGASPISLRITGYTSVGCTGTAVNFDFLNGLRNGASGGGSTMFKNDPGTGTWVGKNAIFLNHGVHPAPSISSVTPSSGGWGGHTLITITGANFENTATVTVGGQNCGSINHVNSTQIDCIPPRTATKGVANIVVTNPSDSQSATYTAFSYVEDGFGNASDVIASTVPSTFNITNSFGTAAGGSLGSRSYHSYRNVYEIAASSGGGDIQGKTLTLSTGFTLNEFSTGDDVMWHVSAAENSTACDSASLDIGMFGFSRVVSADTTSSKITLADVVTSSPNNAKISNASRGSGFPFCAIQVVRVPNFENVAISPGAALTMSFPPYDLTNGYGGIFVMKVADTLTLSGSYNITVDGNGMGFPGGATSNYSGDGFNGQGLSSNLANGSGGAGGSGASGATGGANVGAGGNGASNSNFPAATSSNAFASTANFGGGGGAGTSTAYGGNGGGIVLVYARNLTYSTYSGTFSLGANGLNGNGGGASGGGGGAGGAAMLQTITANNNSVVISANGGTGASATYGGGGGGGGFAGAMGCGSSPTSGTPSKAGGTGYVAGGVGTGGLNNYGSGAGPGTFTCP